LETCILNGETWNFKKLMTL